MTKTRKVTLEVTDRNAVYINGTRITGRDSKWGIHRTMLSIQIKPTDIVETLNEYGYGYIKLDADYHQELMEELGYGSKV